MQIIVQVNSSNICKNSVLYSFLFHFIFLYGLLLILFRPRFINSHFINLLTKKDFSQYNELDAASIDEINEVFYMSGSQLTSSRINYQDDIELIVIGKGSTTTYKDNLDYNLPYRASFLVKNWPYYSYNTSSYWYLPVPLNASNNDIFASGDIWVTASFQNGTDVFTDQYGFAIDI